MDLDSYIDNIDFTLNNKRKYVNGYYYDLLVNNNSHLILLFEANIYDFNSKKKIFLQIKEKEYNNYLVLISKIKKDLNKHVTLNNSLFTGNNNANHNYILADINKSKNDVFTKIFKLNNNKFNSIHIDFVPLNFKTLIAIRIKSLLEKNHNFMLNNDIFQIIIKDEIILDKNEEPEDLNIIKDFIEL